MLTYVAKHPGRSWKYNRARIITNSPTAVAYPNKRTNYISDAPLYCIVGPDPGGGGGGNTSMRVYLTERQPPSDCFIILEKCSNRANLLDPPRICSKNYFFSNIILIGYIAVNAFTTLHFPVLKSLAIIKEMFCTSCLIYILFIIYTCVPSYWIHVN